MDSAEHPVSDASIIHVDMDAFYASVEQLDEPALKGQPVIVGGLGPRGVVSAASYEAREFGVFSAMPIARARRLCPKGQYRKPRMDRYRQVSRLVFEIFNEVTPRVEGLSLDEAFLDVSGSLKLFGSIEDIGQNLKEDIRQRTGLTASVGMAPNKFLAKLASEARKPDGFLRIRPADVQAFLDPMPIRNLWGIGKATEPRLKALGILTVGQLRRADPGLLKDALGNRVGHFQRLARGEDARNVDAKRPDRSISHEVTFDVDLLEVRELLSELQRQSERVAWRLRKQGLSARTVTVKIRDSQFQTATRSRSMRAPSSSTRTLYRMARALFEKWRKSHRTTAVRLLGMGVSGLEEDPNRSEGQANLADSSSERRLDRVLDGIQERFGSDGIHLGLAVRKRRDEK